MARRRLARSRVERIDRDRPTITAARRAFAHRLMQFLPHRRHAIAAEIVADIAAAKRAAEKAAGAPEWWDALDEAEQQKIIDAIVAGLDVGDWSQLVPELSRILVGVATDGVHVGFGQISVDPDADLTTITNDRAVAWAEARAAELVGMRVDADGALVENPSARWRIDEGTRELLRGDIRDAIEQGMSTDDLADQLAASYAFSDARAETIARTELARADVAGNMAAYRESGVVGGKEWVLGSEHDEDDECDDAADLGVVDLDDDFDGLGDPPAHPRCVCDVLPVLFEDMGDAGAAAPSDDAGEADD